MRKVRVVGILAAALAALGLPGVPPSGTGPAAAAPVPPTINEFFVIGVDFQRASSFATWRTRGINTVVRRRGNHLTDPNIPDNDTFEEFDSAAIAAGLKAIRGARTPSSLDLGMPHLIATLSADEPEFGYCNYVDGYKGQKARRDSAAGAGVPFFTNYVGPWILNDPDPIPCPIDPETKKPIPNGEDYCGIRGHEPNQWCYGEFMRATDWISFDIYPKNGGRDINEITAVMNRIAGVYPGGNIPPRLAYIEASNNHCDTTYPNQWHVVYEAVQAVIAGARGIIYYPHGQSGCTGDDYGPDHTAPAVQQEMTRLNFALQRVPGLTMQSTVNPTGVRFESGTTSGQIKSGTRADAVNAYYFTENDSGSAYYSHVVRFHGISNCAGKVVTVLNDTVTSTNPYTYVDRTLQLDQFCQTTVPETWAPYRYHIYQVPRN